MQELVMRKSYAKVDEVALVPVVHIVASVHVVPIVAALYIPIVAPPPHKDCITIDTLVYLCMPLHFLNT